MTYAIVEISGRQFWIELGKKKYYDFNRIPTELNKKITLNRVLLINIEDNILIGKPYLKNVKVDGKILKHLRGKKGIAYKMKSKKKTRKKQGYRQELTRVLIENIHISYKDLKALNEFSKKNNRGCELTIMEI